MLFKYNCWQPLRLSSYCALRLLIVFYTDDEFKGSQQNRIGSEYFPTPNRLKLTNFQNIFDVAAITISFQKWLDKLNPTTV